MTMTGKEKDRRIHEFVAKVKADRNGPLTFGDTKKIFQFIAQLSEKQNSQILKNLKRRDAM